MTSLTTGRVTRCLGGTYSVETDAGVVDCVLRGRIKQFESESVAVGDEVEVEMLPGGDCRIATILPRRSKLSRRSVARRREQVIAANVDRIVPVFSVRRPSPDYRMLDRLLVLAELNQLRSLIVLNKWDLLDDADAEESAPSEAGLAAVLQCAPEPLHVVGSYVRAGYEVLATSAKTGEGLDKLHARLDEGTSVLAGPSGVGKSSLLNAIAPDLDLRVGVLSDRVGRGRHTTVGASLHRLPGDGYVVDTPGLQYLSLWELEASELAAAFPEFRPLVGDCRFANCRHLHEPHCAVAEAVAADRICETRYQSYLCLLEEALTR